jgi:hypothetical protein
VIDQAMTAAVFHTVGPSVAPDATIHLDLRQSDAELSKSMTYRTRHNIRKTINAHLEIGRDRDVAVFHRLHAATAERQGFAPISIKDLQAQYDLLARSGFCTIFVAGYKGVPVAGLWLTRFAGTITFKLPRLGFKFRGATRERGAPLGCKTVGPYTGAHTYGFGGFDRPSAEYTVGVGH